jgi:hypothetical protein
VQVLDRDTTRESFLGQRRAVIREVGLVTHDDQVTVIAGATE